MAKFRYCAGDSKVHSRLINQYEETVEKFGVDVLYIQCDLFDKSLMIGEWGAYLYKVGVPMILKIVGISEMTNSDIFSKFGFDNIDTLKAFTTIRKFDINNIIPKKNDLIFLPNQGNILFEVTNVKDATENQKFNFGAPFAYEISIQKYNVELTSSFNTQNYMIDELNLSNVKTEEETKEKIFNVVDKVVNIDNNPLLEI